MILVLGGTADSRMVVRELKKAGYPVMVSVVSHYGGALASGESPDEVLIQALDAGKLTELLRGLKIRAVVDATHPYARNISAMALRICQELGVKYLRFSRPGASLPEHPLITIATGYPEAAEAAARTGEVVFLTTGSKTLEVFTEVAGRLERKIIARVLPDPQVIEKCLKLGLQPGQIIAMQGPFSKELNKAMFQQTGARVVVTKESGHVGGVDAKVEAALELAIPVVVIARPEEENQGLYKTVTKIIGAIREGRID
ncbi:MAG: precorrin-6A reductase [Clostridia bacterium]|nr:precorrin-6A reductase [Clostridia bacterium]